VTVDYKATKTAARYHKDNSFVRLLIGPVGCGKSVASCIELFRRSVEQESGHDGIRRVRVGIVRNTYPELKSTTIKTWLDWFPEKEFGKLKWDSPITHHIHLQGIEIEAIFLALDSEDDVKKLMSFEFTFLYINELQFVHHKIFTHCLQRVNRYPGKKTGASITWTGVIADTNPPSTRHWIYNLFSVNKPDNFSVYKYEPALLSVEEKPTHTDYAVSRDGTIYINNPNADYLFNLPDINYYLNQVPSSTDEEIKVYMLGEYGVVIDGKPVHPEYKDRLHYPDKELIYNPQLELGFGWDFGLTPAVAIVQFTAKGQLVVLDELYSEYSGLKGFVENTVIPHLNRKYPNWRVSTSPNGFSGSYIQNYISRHDPAGQQGAQTDEKTCQQILQKFGIESLPAATSNAPTARREGLKYHLNRLSGGEPAFLVSNTCPVIREGLMGHFQYGRIQAGGNESRYHEKPLKNMHSHICEALEYIAMYYAVDQTKYDDNSQIMKSLVSNHNLLRKMRSGLYD
jgi:hypothetical protein